MRHRAALVVLSHRYNFLAEWSSRTWPTDWPICVIHVGKTKRQVDEFLPSCSVSACLSIANQTHHASIDQLLGIGTTQNPSLRAVARDYDALVMLDHDVLFEDPDDASRVMRQTIDMAMSHDCLLWAQPNPATMRTFFTSYWFVVNVKNDWNHMLDAYGIPPDERTWAVTGNVDPSNHRTYFDTGQRLAMKLASTPALNMTPVDWPIAFHLSSSWADAMPHDGGMKFGGAQVLRLLRERVDLYVSLADVEALRRSNIHRSVRDSLIARRCRWADRLD